MSAGRESSDRRPARDGVLIAALIAAFLLCLHGITVPIRHPDQMAFRELFLPDKAPLNPGWFERPPGYSYLNWLLVVAPVSGLGRVLALPAERVVPIEIVASRVLAAGLLLATVALAYGIARAGFGRRAARVVAVVLATSAGVIGFVHQLTADVPTMFWMVLAFHFAARLTRADRTADYVAAGLCTGIAAATKYNGLGVGIAIVVAHALRVWSAAPSRSWAAAGGAAVFHRGLWLGLAMVPAGFLLANPYALFDATTFLADVRYNAMVTPVYEGQHGTSYGAFVARLAELIGAPAIALGLVAAAWALVRGLEHGRVRWAVLAAAFVGFAFLTKYLQAYLVLPAFALTWVVAAPGSLGRRIGGLLAAAAVVAVSSLWWVWVPLLLGADRVNRSEVK
jgi:4-amino-4-deoxy-L-arabinose transferase-like glycosyltransferase